MAELVALPLSEFLGSYGSFCATRAAEAFSWDSGEAASYEAPPISPLPDAAEAVPTYHVAGAQAYAEVAPVYYAAAEEEVAPLPPVAAPATASPWDAPPPPPVEESAGPWGAAQEPEPTPSWAAGEVAAAPGGEPDNPFAVPAAGGMQVWSAAPTTESTEVPEEVPAWARAAGIS